MDGVEVVDHHRASVLLIGFCRVGQIVSQPLLGRACSITIIETDTDAIRDANDFGFKVHYGDGSRLDILHAAGAGEARVVIVAVDDQEASVKIVELMKAEFPLVPVIARAFDRQHALQLVQAGVDYQIRETLESSLTLAEKALELMDVDEDERAVTMADIRLRDSERFASEVAGGLEAGRPLIYGNAAKAD